MALTNGLELHRMRRVMVLRALQLGDMLCAVPALRALRGAAPDAVITLVGLPWARAFAGRFSHYIDEFVEWPGWPGLPECEPDFDSIPAFLANMRARRFDLAIQMHGDGSITNPAVALMGARLVAGSYRVDGWRPPGRFVVYPEQLPERQRSLRVLQSLGIDGGDDCLEFPVHDDDRRALREAAASLHDRRYVCIHPGARSETRRWPALYFATVGDALAEEGFTVVVTGTESERRVVDEVVGTMEHEAVNLAGQTTLGALGALIEGSEVLICNDTGVSHMADALRTPSVVAFTSSDPARWAPSDRWMHRIVQHPQTLEPGTVLRHARELLARAATYAS